MNQVIRFFYLTLAILAIPSLGYIGMLSMQAQGTSGNWVSLLIWSFAITLLTVWTALTVAVGVIFFGRILREGDD